MRAVLFGLVASVLLGGTAIAQDQSEDRKRPDREPVELPATEAPAKALEQRNEIFGLPDTEVIGQMVFGLNNEQIGTVDAVVVSRVDPGRPALVVGVGGLLGIGERDVAIPFERLVTDSGGQLRTRLTRDEISALPAYDESAWQVWNPSTPLEPSNGS